MQSTNFTTNWETVSGFPNYQVSDTGLVCNKWNKQVLKPRLDKGGYVIVDLFNDGSRKTMRVHRLVANAFIPNLENKPNVDHIDGDKLNNHVSNLRWATNSENGINKSRPSTNSSGFKGVSRHKGSNKWTAYIGIDGKNHFLGRFDTAELAAEAYNKAALDMFGEFAKINKPIVKIPITITLKMT